jgi:hypothetical protein
VIAVARRMKQPRLSTPASIAAAAIAIGLSSYAGAVPNLDPFARNMRAQALAPFRTAQAEAEPLSEKQAAQSGSATPFGGFGTDSPPHQPPGASRPPVASTGPVQPGRWSARRIPFVNRARAAPLNGL